MSSASGDFNQYHGKNCIVTGGLGFIGSNLVVRLVHEGAKVTVIDSGIAGCGSNGFNLAGVADSVRILDCDIGHPEKLRGHMDRPDVIFNVAGEISHSMSMSHPERDLEINTSAQLRFLLFCRETYAGARIVYASTRQLYGKPQYLPVDENHPIEPIDFNGVHKGAADQYHLLLSRRGELDCVVLRLSNVYGPRMALHLPQQGVLNVYLATALQKKALSIYGDGMQLRDPVYVDDAVEAFLRAGTASTAEYRVYNISGMEALTMRNIADVITRAASSPPAVNAPFPTTAHSIDIGSYVSECTRARCGLGWTPSTTFEMGIRKTLKYYSGCADNYLAGPRVLIRQ